MLFNMDVQVYLHRPVMLEEFVCRIVVFSLFNPETTTRACFLFNGTTPLKSYRVSKRLSFSRHGVLAFTQA